MNKGINQTMDDFNSGASTYNEANKKNATAIIALIPTVENVTFSKCFAFSFLFFPRFIGISLFIPFEMPSSNKPLYAILKFSKYHIPHSAGPKIFAAANSTETLDNWYINVDEL